MDKKVHKIGKFFADRIFISFLIMPRNKMLLLHCNEQDFMLIREILLQLTRNAQIIRLTNEEGLQTYLRNTGEGQPPDLIIVHQPPNLVWAATRIQRIIENRSGIRVVLFAGPDQLVDRQLLPSHDWLYVYRIPTAASEYKRILHELLKVSTGMLDQQPSDGETA
jgi:hypothetical protein